MSRIAVYGASGYVGRLVAAALATGGHDVVLAGRDGARLRALGSQVAVAPLDDAPALARALDGCDAVVNCTGPFVEHGAPVIEAAIGAGVHYADTAAEQAWVHEVFERYGPLAEARGVALVPAAGFDFLPGDLACALAAGGLGPLGVLEVAYAVDSFRMSRGTLRSALAGMARRPLAYEDGGWRFASPAGGARLVGRRFDFPRPFGARFVAPFPAGEVVTAPRHVAVRSVRALIAARTLTLGAAPLAPLVAPALPLAGALLRGPVPRLAEAVIGRLPEGPSATARRRARWLVVAAAHAEDGRRRRVALSGSDVYGTTAASAAHAAALLAGTKRRGALAPAQAFEPQAFLAHLGVARETG